MKEDESAGPKTDSRTLLAKFNVQIAPLYDLLKETENIEFTPTMTDPEPSFVPALHADDDSDPFFSNPSGGPRSPGGTGANGKWSTGKSGGFKDAFKVTWNGSFRGITSVCFFQFEVVIGEQDDKKQEVLKTVPTWMTESTVVVDPIEALITPSFQLNPQDDTAKDEVHELLKQTESKPAQAGGPQTALPTATITADSSEDDFIDDDDDDDQLTVQGRSYSYHQIQSDPKLVQQMTGAEKEEYTQYVKRVYEEYM